MKALFTFLLITVIPALLSALLAAQEAEMADTMRSEGKIYVVVAMVLVVLLGLLIYLVMLDRKIGKVERQMGNKS